MGDLSKPINGVGLAQINKIINDRLGIKQNKLTGAQGQVVGFDGQGNAVAQAAPSGGMTQTEADARYLKLSGGILSSLLGFAPSSPELVYSKNDKNAYVYLDQNRRIQIKGKSKTYIATETPLQNTDAANKKYVDDQIDARAGGVPSGCILIWSGSSDEVPDGWVLCDGANGTPNLGAQSTNLYYIMKL